MPVGTAPGAGNPETDFVAEGAALEDDPLIMVDEALEAPLMPELPIIDEEPDWLMPDEPPIIPLEADAAAVEAAEEAPDCLPVAVEPAVAAEPSAEVARETVERAWRGAITAAEADKAPASVAMKRAFMSNSAGLRSSSEEYGGGEEGRRPGRGEGGRRSMMQPLAGCASVRNRVVL